MKDLRYRVDGRKGQNMKKYVVTDPESLRMLCIDNNWFIDGTIEQYNKMFDMNRVGSGNMTFAVRDVALCIWVCSGDVPYNEIFRMLQDAHNSYVLNH